MENENSFKGRITAFQMLGRILQGGAYSNIVIRNIAKDRELSENDRAMATQLTYGVLRNLTLLDEVLRTKSRRQQLSISPTALILGRMALFEILFMDSVPAYASVSEYVEMVNRNATPGEASFLNACLRHSAPEDVKKVIDSAGDMAGRTALRYSHPKWFVQILTDVYNEKICEEILAADNTASPLYVRVNARRADASAWLKEWKKFKCRSASPPPCCVEAPQGVPPDAWEIGQISMQDRSTQIVPYFLDLKPGDKILDLCCGTGAKTTHIAEMAGAEADITSVDIHEAKLEELRKECRRLMIQPPKAMVADLKTKPELGQFNKVLIDVPCTGTAVFRRRPEIRYRVKFTDLDRVVMQQDELLDAAGGTVAPGGTLLYVTCSLLPMENEAVVRKFLAAHPNFTETPPPAEAAKMAATLKAVSRPGGLTFLPQNVNGNGLFISHLTRSES